MSASLPTITLLEREDARLRAGSPWIFANQIQMRAGDAPARTIEPGSLVRVQNAKRQKLGVAHFNPNALIAARLLSRNADAQIDAAFLARRIARALSLRETLYDAPYYRLIHGEADLLPGLVIDRFGDLVVVQLNTLGWAALESALVDALEHVLAPARIVLRADAPAAAQEGLDREARVAKGAVDGPVAVIEEALEGRADPLHGQKTGWFFDQRANRAFTAKLAAERDVLDLYAHAGGFALAAIRAGAKSARAIDSSERALALGGQSPSGEKVQFERADALQALGAIAGEKTRYGLVVADPPPFVRAKKDRAQGMKAYRKLARLAAKAVSEGGFLAIASCSHNAAAADFEREVAGGLREAGRSGQLILRAGAAPDHPIHPALPETAYLKFLTYRLD